MNSFFSNMFNNVLWNVLSAFIIFCISQLWYFNTKKSLEFYFKFTKDDESEDDDLTAGYVNQIAGYFVKLLSINKGDIIVIPANGKLNIFQATFGYQYSDGFAENLAPHTINVEDIRLDIDVSFFNVTPRFKRAVQNRLTIISLNQYSEQIHTLIK